MNLKVNFIVEISPKSGGIYTAASTYVKKLKENGIDAEINSKDDYDILHTIL